MRDGWPSFLVLLIEVSQGTSQFTYISQGFIEGAITLIYNEAGCKQLEGK